MNRAALVILLAIGAGAGAPASAQAGSKKPAPRNREHASVGAPNHGSLQGAKRWQDRPWAQHMARHERAATFALPVLVSLIDRAARRVAKAFPKSVLLVGDMSLEHGGPISGHHSHQNGRDVDVGFYAVDTKGRSVRVVQFTGFDSSGKNMVSGDVHFDDARNWALISTMLTDGRAEVRSIFIASWLRARLLAHGAKVKASKDLLERAATLMMQPPNAEPHHDHFHVRLACPLSQRGKTCFDDSFARTASTTGSAADAHAAQVGNDR